MMLLSFSSLFLKCSSQKILLVLKRLRPLGALNICLSTVSMIVHSTLIPSLAVHKNTKQPWRLSQINTKPVLLQVISCDKNKQTNNLVCLIKIGLHSGIHKVIQCQQFRDKIIKYALKIRTEYQTKYILFHKNVRKITLKSTAKLVFDV